MRAGTILRMLLMGLAATLALPLAVGVLALRAPASGARAAAGGPSVVATVAVGTRPWGVAVNSSTNRIYVANYNSNNVSVIDGANNTIVATVSVGSNPYGAALNPSTNRIYVANQGDDTVSVIQDYLVPPSVGGISEAPDVADTNPEASASDRSRIPVPAEVAAALAASVVALGVGGWYAKRRWQR